MEGDDWGFREPDKTHSIYSHEKIRYFLSKCTSLADICFGDILRGAVEISQQGSTPWQQCYEIGLRDVEEWSKRTIRHETDQALLRVADFNEAFEYTFVCYAQNFYGRDSNGKKNRLQVTIPPVSEFIHAFYTLCSQCPSIQNTSFFNNEESKQKIIKVVLRDALHVCSKGKVFSAE